MALDIAPTRSSSANTPKGGIKAKSESQVMLKENKGRLNFSAVNNGAKSVWVALGAEAKAEEGIWLKAEGGSWVEDKYSGVVSLCTKEGESLVTFCEV